MSRCFSALMLLAFVSIASGCSMGQSVYDDAYPTYGGKWERVDRYEGRVGSAFQDASSVVANGEDIEWIEEMEITDFSELEEIQTADLNSVLQGPEVTVGR